MYAENAVDDELIREGQQNILSYFQKKGYFDADGGREGGQDAGRASSIVYNIHKDGGFKVDGGRDQGQSAFQRQGTGIAREREEGELAVVLARHLQPATGARSAKNLTRHLQGGGVQRGAGGADGDARQRERRRYLPGDGRAAERGAEPDDRGQRHAAAIAICAAWTESGAGQAVFRRTLVAKDRSLIMAQLPDAGVSERRLYSHGEAGARASAPAGRGVPHRRKVRRCRRQRSSPTGGSTRSRPLSTSTVQTEIAESR